MNYHQRELLNLLMEAPGEEFFRLQIKANEGTAKTKYLNINERQVMMIWKMLADDAPLPHLGVKVEPNQRTFRVVDRLTHYLIREFDKYESAVHYCHGLNVAAGYNAVQGQPELGPRYEIVHEEVSST